MKALLFKIGAETFALDFKQIQKIVESPELYAIPLVPSYFMGTVNFHNQIVPVLDLAAYLDIVAHEKDPRVIILDLSQYAMALSVGSIKNYNKLEEVKTLPCKSNSMLSSVSRLVALEDGQPIRILEPASLQKRLTSDLLARNGKAWYLSRPVLPAEDTEAREGFCREEGTSLVSAGFSLSSGPQSGSR